MTDFPEQVSFVGSGCLSDQELTHLLVYGMFPRGKIFARYPDVLYVLCAAIIDHYAAPEEERLAVDFTSYATDIYLEAAYKLLRSRQERLYNQGTVEPLLDQLVVLFSYDAASLAQQRMKVGCSGTWYSGVRRCLVAHGQLAPLRMDWFAEATAASERLLQIDPESAADLEALLERGAKWFEVLQQASEDHRQK